MSSSTSSIPHPQRKQSDSDQASEPDSAKSASGDESPSSDTEENNRAENKLKDDENVDPRGSGDPSATLSDVDSG